MTSVITLKSAYRMHCFSCNKPIEKGEEITQCLESSGMNLRRRSFISARWVHQFCVPTHMLTRYYLEVLDDYQRAYPDTDFGDIDTIVENLAYWEHQKGDETDSECDSFESDSDDSTYVPSSPSSPSTTSSDDLLRLDDTLSWYKKHATWSQLKKVFDTLLHWKEEMEFHKVVDDTLTMLRSG